MNFFENRKITIICFLFYISFEYILTTESVFSYGMKYAKIYKLNNGNIIVVGNVGIDTYDSTGINLLFSFSITENKITSANDGFFTRFVQFSTENNELALVMVNHIIYILNSVGKVQFNYKLTQDISQTKFYSIVPYIYKDDFYHFILGYIDSDRKIFLQYYIIDLPNKSFLPQGYYKFDEGDLERIDVGYDNGITCEFMNHYSYKIVLTCFYQNTNPEEISTISFKLKDNQLEIIPNLNKSYSDSSFCLQSAVSSDRKKTLLCYIRNKDNERRGYCSVYNIDDNKFEKYEKYITNQCDADIYRLSVDYYKETKEYIFSCTNGSPNIYIVKFDQNFDIIKINSTQGENQNESTLSISECYSTYFYSILFISNAYSILGDFSCNNADELTTLYSIPDEYKPLQIYSDIIEISLNDDDIVEYNPASQDSDSDIVVNNECHGYKNSEGTI